MAKRKKPSTYYEGGKRIVVGGVPTRVPTWWTDDMTKSSTLGRKK